MLSGFNTNVRHRGLLLHVQTEDSGRAHPHVITHLYHGGTILASDRSQYGDRLESGDLAAEVRALMEEQHRSMLRRLKRGELDPMLVERLGSQVLPDDTGVATASGANGGTLPGGPVGPPPGAPGAISRGEDRSLDEVVLEYLIERAARLRGSAS